MQMMQQQLKPRPLVLDAKDVQAAKGVVVAKDVLDAVEAVAAKGIQQEVIANLTDLKQLAEQAAYFLSPYPFLHI